MMKRMVRFVLSLLLAAGTVFHPGTPSLPGAAGWQEVNAAGEKQAAVYGWYDQDLSYQVLTLVNKYRRENGLAALQMDEDLFSAAMLRAAECTVSFSHTRPNGTACFTASNKMFAENIAWGATTAEEVMNLWMNSSGHRGNILGSYTTIGIGVFWYGGTYYWTQCFGVSTSVKQVTSTYQGYGIGMFPVAGDLANTSLSTPSLTIVKGSKDAAVIELNGRIPMHPIAYNWTSANPGIASVDSYGIITGVNYGTTTLTAVNKLDSNDVFHVTVKVADGIWRKDSYGWWYDQGSTYPHGEFKDIGGITYYFGNDGYMATGWQSVKGSWYFFDGNGAMQKGWQRLGGSWYYLSEVSGAMQTGWLQQNNNWYYLESDGHMATGWINVNSKWYYMNGKGAMQTGWQKIGGTWYYFDSKGAMQTGWQSIDNVWYYFDGSGAMQTGWINVNNKWYYMSGSGVMQTGWQKISGTWYYFSIESGAMQTGWQSIDGSWYYFDGSGAMQTGWQSINGSWYYMYSDGKMAANTWIDGYYVDSNGRLKDTSIPEGTFATYDEAKNWGMDQWRSGQCPDAKGFDIDGYQTGAGVWYYVVTFY